MILRWAFVFVAFGWVGSACSSAQASPSRADASTAEPEEIVFVDGDTQKVVSRTPVSQVPDGQRYVALEDGGRASVVKAVMFRRGDGREIKEYGSHGELLRTTLGSVPRSPHVPSP